MEMDPRSLVEWKAELEQRLVELEEQVRPILSEVERIRQQLDLVAKLEVLQAGGSSMSNGGLARQQDVRRLIEPASGASVGDVLAKILADAGEPLHISAIRERYLATGRHIPGQGTISNLLAYMGDKDGRFERVAKGTYRLKAGASNMTPRPKAKRRRRRKRHSITKPSRAGT